MENELNNSDSLYPCDNSTAGSTGCPFPLHLATLEINGFTTRIFLLRHQRHGIIAVDYHAPGVDTSHKEHLFFGIVSKCGNTERLVYRHPACAFEIDFRPVVQVPGTRMHHKAALETGGNATATAEGDKQQAHLTAIAVTIVEHIFRNILNSGIFAGRSPGEMIVYPTENALCLQQRIGFTDCQIGSQLLDAGVKRIWVSRSAVYSL